MTTNDRLVVSLRNAARVMAGKRSIRDLQLTLGHIVAAAVETVPHVDAGGISITEDGEIASRNPTSEAVSELDRLQSHLREGPCISAILEPPEDGMVVAQDLAGKDGEHWPGFAPKAVEAGYRAMISTQLSADGGSMQAALNLYAREPNAFDAEARLTAALFGVQAAMLLYGSEHVANLQRAVNSRDVIGQAKGILMERFHVDEDSAFQMLVSSSQETNIKLVEVARWLRDEARARSRPGQGAAAGD